MSAPTELWLAAGYAAFLIAVSSGLRWLARRTARGPRLSWLGRSGRGDDDTEVPWPHSDAARFERGLARVLQVLAMFILAVTAARHRVVMPLPIGALLLLVLLTYRGWLMRRLKHGLGRK